MKKREFILNCPGSIQTLSKEEFLEAADEIAMMNAMSNSSEDDNDDDDDDDDGGELVAANAEEREIAVMLNLDEKPKTDGAGN